MSFLVIERFRLILAKTLIMQDMFEEAYEIYAKMIERLDGNLCLEYGVALGGVGFILYKSGECEVALEYYRHAVKVVEQLQPCERRNVNLASLYSDMSVLSSTKEEYLQSMKYVDHALELLEQMKFSVAKRYLSNVYNNKMICCAMDGDIEGAVECLVKAIKYKDVADRLTFKDMNTLLENNLHIFMNNSIEHPDVLLRLLNMLLACPELDGTMHSIILENGSIFFSRVGDYDRALEYAKLQLDCCSCTYGPKSLQVANAYIRIASCCRDIPPDSKYWNMVGENALFCSYTALEILQNYFMNETKLIAEASHCLALVLIRAGRYDDALRYLRQAMDKSSQINENDTIAVCNILESFVELYIEQGKFPKALDYAEHILETIKKKQHIDSFRQVGIYSETIFLELLCDRDSAVKHVRELMALWPKVLENILTIFHEDLRLSCVRMLKGTASLFFSTAFKYPQAFETEELYEFTLKMNHIDNELDYIYAQHFQDLHSPELQIARARILELEKVSEWLTVDGKSSTQEYSHVVKRLEEAKGDELRALGGSKAGNAFLQPRLADIQRMLGKNEVLIEYRSFPYIKSNQGETNESAMCYCAFAVTQTSVELCLLGSSEDVDTLVNSLISEIEEGRCVNELLGSVSKTLLFPFQAFVNKALTAYIVPDSVLYKLPFELLVDCIRLKELSIPCSVIYLSSGRELLRNVQAPKMDKILILADPQYNLDEEDVNPDNNVEFASNYHFCDDNIPFDPDELPNLRFSKTEAYHIAALFHEGEAVVMTGKRASKDVLLMNFDADILHISTHGFTYQWECGQDVAMTDLVSDRSKYLKKVKDPLLRCGLFFAGASNWIHGEELPISYRDGVLLGRELAMMGLSQYRLVVLAACQTACGDLNAGEGLKGLRHAFELAGVGCLVCALWKIEDLASAVLMERFYKELLIDGTLPSEALTRAKLYIKNITASELIQAGWEEYLNADVIDQLMEEGQEDYAYRLQDILDFPDIHPFAHPRYWAGFIIQGRCTV